MEALPYLAGILGAIGTLIGAIVGVPAYRAKQRADATAAKVSEVQVGLTALQQALARSDTERAQLIEDRDDLRGRLDKEEERTVRLRKEVGQLRTDLTRHEEAVRGLADQVRSLGGTPIFGGV